jgi:flagellin
MGAQRRLNAALDNRASIFQKLSTGSRINKASDDAAGLAIADSLRADSRIFSQAIRNVNDGISYTNIASSGLTELSNIVTRLKELAEQAATGTLSKNQRGALDQEAQALSDEYQRVIQSTTLNGISVMNPGSERITF